MRGHASEIDASRIKFNEEQDVESTQEHGIDVEEVGGKRGRCLGA